MSHADIALKTQHMTLMENIADESVSFAYMQALPFGRDDSGSILATMLQHSEGIIERLVDRLVSNNSDHAAHALVIQYRNIRQG